MTTLTHDGYLAELEIDEGAGVIHGRVINARAVLTFEGETLAELKAAFADTSPIIGSGARNGAWNRTNPIPGRSHFASPRSFIAASPNRPRRQAKASINSSPNALKKWRDETHAG